jgi:hypothetical protein
MARAEAAIRRAYGSVSARPTVHACVTEKCYAAFGGRGEVAKVFGQRILQKCGFTLALAFVCISHNAAWKS